MKKSYVYQKLICLVIGVLFGWTLVTIAQGATHNVVLAWTPSIDGATNPTLAYNIYRGTTAGGESATPINASPVAAGCTNATTCTYTDTNVTVGATYFYTAKAVLNGTLSAASNECNNTIAVAAPGGLSCKGN